MTESSRQAMPSGMPSLFEMKEAQMRASGKTLMPDQRPAPQVADQSVLNDAQRNRTVSKPVN